MTVARESDNVPTLDVVNGRHDHESLQSAADVAKPSIVASNVSPRLGVRGIDGGVWKRRPTEPTPIQDRILLDPIYRRPLRHRLLHHHHPQRIYRTNLMRERI